MIDQIVSGGQTGADLAALDVALRYKHPHRGWCPKGRNNLDGKIPDCYQLTETPTSFPTQRTEWNVRDSDGTVVFTMAPEPSGGSATTIKFTKRHRKPCLHVSAVHGDAVVDHLRNFVTTHQIRTLNVAGSRESKEPGIYSWVASVLERAFFKTQEDN